MKVCQTDWLYVASHAEWNAETFEGFHRLTRQNFKKDVCLEPSGNTDERKLEGDSITQDLAQQTQMDV